MNIMNKYRGTSMTEEELFFPEEAAERLAVSLPTIHRRILERRIGYVKIGRSVRIPLSEIRRIISEGWHKPIGIENDGRTKMVSP